MSTYTILASDLSYLSKKVKHISKKCAANGIPFTFIAGEPYKKVVSIKRTSYVFMVVDVEVECFFKHNGWSVLGCVTRTNGITQCYFDDPSLLRQYKDTDFNCDHCHKRVRRNSVVVLEHEDGRRVVVGTSCVKEFTCGLDGELVLEKAKFSDYLYSLLFDSDKFDPDKEYSISSWGLACLDILPILSCAFYYCRTYGYYGKDCPYDKVPTKFLVHHNWRDNKFEPEDENNAHDALQWIKDMSEDEYLKNTYLFNIRQIVDAEYCTADHIGLISSIPVAYNKSKISRIEKKNKKESTFVGELGDKITVSVVMKNSIPYDSIYGGGYIHLFIDAEGNTFKWSTQKCLRDVAVGDPLEISGIIKDHDEYRGEKQTVLTRCRCTRC